MNRTLGDAHYFLALLSSRDQDHAKAVTLSREWAGEIVTTRWILAEVADGLSAPPTRGLAAAFIRHLEENPFVRIEPVTEAQFTRGLDLYLSRPDKEWSLTDCISFVVMADEGLTQALTGDHHFEQAGFVALLR
ncbi:type II toxin-antitoxin system VapC family toxin [Luteolibacter sp. Populi]|uniref:type II toxin-antitoxin system VapC family toxin n=1 Tax=Luteolibacter sp. Populi TaxID=3230487 RepID=UPI0034657097